MTWGRQAAIRQLTLNYYCLRLYLSSRLLRSPGVCGWLPQLQNPRRNPKVFSHAYSKRLYTWTVSSPTVYLQLLTKHFVPREGFKPPTFALGKPCSIQLSYRECGLRRSTTTPNPELIVASPGREPFEILVGLGNHPSTPLFLLQALWV